MTPRQTLFPALAAAFAIAPLAAAYAFEFQSYQAPTVLKAIESGKPVIVHVYAPWCLQCQAQAAILDNLKSGTKPMTG